MTKPRACLAVAVPASAATRFSNQAIAAAIALRSASGDFTATGSNNFLICTLSALRNRIGVR